MFSTFQHDESREETSREKPTRFLHVIWLKYITSIRIFTINSWRVIKNNSNSHCWGVYGTSQVNNAKRSNLFLAIGFLFVTLQLQGEALLSHYRVTSRNTLMFRLKLAHIGEKHGFQHTNCFSWLYFSLPRRAKDISSLAIKASCFKYACLFYISKWNIFETYRQSKNNSLYFCGHNYYYMVHEKSKGICQDRLKRLYFNQKN